MEKNKAVFLDRDGVINHSVIREGKPYAPRTLSDFKLLPKVEDAVKIIKEAGFMVFVVTNQPDIGNGLVEPSVVQQMNDKLLKLLPIDKVYMCVHKQTDGCDCRKPKPGMLLQAKSEFNIDMANSFMVGDRYSDVCAAEAAGCQPIFIDYEYLETPEFDASMSAESLYHALNYILGKNSHG